MRDRDTIHPIKRHCEINVILKLSSESKKLHRVALTILSHRWTKWGEKNKAKQFSTVIVKYIV